MLRLSFLPISCVLNLLPYWVVSFVSKALGFFLFSVVRFRREVVLKNLALALGNELNTQELLELARKNYTHNVLILLEWVQSVSWTAEDFRQKTKLHCEPLYQQMAAGESGFILTSHLGNWEFAIQSVTAHGIPCDVIVKRQRTRLAQTFFEWFRDRFGGRVIYESGTTSDILRSLKQKRFPTFVLDQFMGPPIGLPVKFFGRPAGTAIGLALLTEKTSAPLFTAYNYRDDQGVIQVFIEKVKDMPNLSADRNTRFYQLTQFYNDILERQIRQHPEQWLWLHRRWKAYNGQPRWSLKPILASCLVLIGLQGCSAPQVATTSTGIDLPPDPQIAAPVYNTQDSTEKTVVQQEATKPSGSAAKKTKPQLKKQSTKADQPNNSFSIVPVEKVPFEIGERLVVDLTWLTLPAGKGTLEVRPGPLIAGRPTYHLWGNVLTSKMVDAIYHVDNTIESFIDQSGFIPYKFLLSMFESAQKKETRVAFDHSRGKSFYWSKRISEKWGNEDIDRVDSIESQARDMFSAIYYARALDYEINQKRSFWIYENGQNLNVELLPLAREIVTSGAGVFQCWKIKVDVKLNNVLRPTGDLYLWLSDDSKKYLVKFDAKVKIGSLLGRLISIKER